MKNLFLAAIAALALFASCSKNSDEFADVKGSVVSVSFVDEPSRSRAFFGATAAAEAWEKELNSLTVFVFNSTGNLLIQRQFTTAELDSKNASFVLPGTTSGENCDFYAVANNTFAALSDKAALLALLESSASVYNGLFAEVTTKAKRTGGFVMSGNTSKIIAPAGTTTSVALTLKRTVAKIAIEASTTSDFSSKYPGAVRINSAKIIRGASQSPIIKPVTVNTGAMNFNYLQASNSASGKFQNLFYVFENDILTEGNRVAVELDATYDLDGIFTTTADQTPMTYVIELEGASGGAIYRNGYYRVQVNINGLIGNDATVSLTVADWEIPVTQTINIGL